MGGPAGAPGEAPSARAVSQGRLGEGTTEASSPAGSTFQAGLRACRHCYLRTRGAARDPPHGGCNRHLFAQQRLQNGRHPGPGARRLVRRRRRATGGREGRGRRPGGAEPAARSDRWAAGRGLVGAGPGSGRRGSFSALCALACQPCPRRPALGAPGGPARAQEHCELGRDC